VQNRTEALVGRAPRIGTALQRPAPHLGRGGMLFSRLTDGRRSPADDRRNQRRAGNWTACCARRLIGFGTDMHSAPAGVPAVPLLLQRDDHDGGVLLDLTPVRQRGLNLNHTCVELRRHMSHMNAYGPQAPLFTFRQLMHARGCHNRGA
jgi:hypothetical protein